MDCAAPRSPPHGHLSGQVQQSSSVAAQTRGVTATHKVHPFGGPKGSAPELSDCRLDQVYVLVIAHAKDRLPPREEREGRGSHSDRVKKEKILIQYAHKMAHCGLPFCHDPRPAVQGHHHLVHVLPHHTDPQPSQRLVRCLRQPQFPYAVHIPPPYVCCPVLSCRSALCQLAKPTGGPAMQNCSYGTVGARSICIAVSGSAGS